MTSALVFCLVLGAAVTWRVQAGPVPIDQVLPFLASALESRTGAVATADGADLVWDDEHHRLVIRLKQVVVVAPGGTATRLPAVDLSYRLRSLVRGTVLPTTVAVYRPRLVLTRDAAGDVLVGVSSATPDAAAAPQPQAQPPVADEGFDLRAVLAPLMTHGRDRLDSIDVVEAEATVIDIPRGRHYSIPRLDANLDRTPRGLVARAQFATLVGGSTSDFDISAAIDESPAEARLTIGFQDVVPSLFAAEFQTLDAAKGVALPVSGTISARLKLPDPSKVTLASLQRAEVRVDIYGGPGTVVAPDPYVLVYPVRGFHLKGNYDGATGQAWIDALRLELDRATLSAEGSARWPLPDAEATAAAADPDAAKGVAAKVSLEITDTSLDTFEHYWPAAIAKEPRSWLVENLRDGRITDARFTAEAAGPDWAGIDVTNFSGEAEVKGATVHYLRPMPPLTGVNGRVLFGLKAIDVLPDTGAVGNLKVQPGGRVRFTGLDEEDQYAEIEADISGPVREALVLLDRDPLRLLHSMGTVDPKAISGDGLTHLTMRFPLLLDLRLKDMTLKATSKLSNIAIKNVLPNRNLSDGALALSVDLDGMQVAGDGKVNGVPLRLGWEERFSGPGTRTRYTVSGSIDDAGRTALGLDFIPFTAPYLRGTATGDMVATVDAKGRMSLGVQMDLSQTAMEVPGLGWRKLQGGAASGTASIRFDKGRLLDIQQFQVQAGDSFAVAGHAAAGPDGRLASLEFRDAKIGRSAFSGGMNFHADGGVDTTLQGPVLDLQPMIGDSGWKSLVDEDEPDPAKPKPKVPPARINGHFDRVWISGEGAMRGVAAELRRGTDDSWTGSVSGDIDGGKPVRFDVVRDGADRRLTATSADAGAVLSAFDFTRSIKGGSLNLDARIPETGPIAGRARIESFNVVDAPILARLVAVASITGIGDLLNGAGVSFWYLDSPFTMEKGVLGVRDFRAAGPSFGVTANGTTNMDSRAVDLKGVVIPVNALNSVITDIPLLGQILGGKDGGLFAMNYTIKGTLEEPDVSVNPFTALVPGGVQKLFTPSSPTLQGGTPPAASPEKK